MAREPRMSSGAARRRFLQRAAFGVVGIVSLASCSPETRTVEISRDPGPTAAPADAPRFLELAALAPAPEAISVSGLSESTAAAGELWVRELALTGAAADVEEWIVASYGTSDGIGRAWVTPSEMKSALGISDVPDTWRLENVTVPGTPYRRMVLVDDSDPTSVRLRLAEVDA